MEKRLEKSLKQTADALEIAAGWQAKYEEAVALLIRYDINPYTGLPTWFTPLQNDSHTV